MNRFGVVASAGLTILLGAVMSCSSDDGPGSDSEITPGSGATGGGGPAPGGTGGASASGGTGGASASGGTGVGGDAGSAAATSGGTGGGTGGTGGSLLECNNSYQGLDDCGTSAVTAEVEPVEILLLVDKSGSMTIQPPGYEDRKWPALRNALNVSLTQLAPYARFGLELFPRQDTTIECGDISQETCCQMGTSVDVEIGDGTETVPLMLAALEDPTGPGGRTPTAAALQLAYDYFGNLPIPIEGEAPDRYIFLATDGGPNCGDAASCPPEECTVNQDGNLADPPVNCGPSGPTNCCDPTSIVNSSTLDCLDDADTLAMVEALWNDLGIKTVVIGIPGSEPYEVVLNQLAVAGQAPNEGGTTSYYRVEANRPEQLTEVFLEITMDLIKSCDIVLMQSPPAPNQVNIALDCEAIPQNNSTSGAANWEIDTTGALPTLRLLGDLCDQATSTGVRRVDVLFGCPTLG